MGTENSKKTVPVKKNKGDVVIVKDKNYEIDAKEHQTPPWAVTSRITKKRTDALTDVVKSQGSFYDAVGERNKSLARLGTVLEDEITAEKAEARLKAMDALERLEAKAKGLSDRKEIEKLTLKIKKLKLENELARLKKDPEEKKTTPKGQYNIYDD